MSVWSKAVIIPLLAALNVMLNLVFGVNIPEEVLNDFAAAIVNLATVVAVIWGILKNLKKKKTS